MKLRNTFIIAVSVLMGTLMIQLVVRTQQKPEPTAFAIWKDRPANLAEAGRLANLIVTGRVTKVERAEDLVAKVPVEVEPTGEIRIPVEVVTIELEKIHKGAPRRSNSDRQTVQVFHTGLSYGTPVIGRAEPAESERPRRPEGAVDKPARIPKPSQEEARTVILHDDPSYKVGDRYVLLLTDGPFVKVRGVPISTKRVISPEGRYKVGRGNKLEPATERGFAGKQKGKSQKDFEKELRKMED